MIRSTNSFFKSFYSLSFYNQPLKFLQLTVNLQKILIFSVSNDGMQWTIDFGPDSVTIAVNDLVQNITFSSQEKPPAAWHLLMSQTQVLLYSHLARVPVTPNQQGIQEMRDEVLSSVGAQDFDTSSYQTTDLEVIDFNWENSQLETDAVFRPGVDTPFLQLSLTIYPWRDQMKTLLCWTKRKTRRMLRLHQHPCMSDPRNISGCTEVVFLSKKGKCARLCLKKIVSISTTVLAFWNKLQLTCFNLS